MKRLISFFLCICFFVTSANAVPIFAVSNGDTVNVYVEPSKKEAYKGEKVTFTVFLGAVSQLISMQMVLDIPKGMEYVADSASLADGLRETLRFDATDWTEQSLMINGGGSAYSYSSQEMTKIASFDCIVKDNCSVGQLKVGLTQLEFYNFDFIEIPAVLNAAEVEITDKPAGKVLHSVTVNNGTAKKTEAESGDKVKIQVDERDGENFQYWRVDSGRVVIEDSRAEKTSFVMNNDDVTITAVFSQAENSQEREIEILDYLSDPSDDSKILVFEEVSEPEPYEDTPHESENDATEVNDTEKNDTGIAVSSGDVSSITENAIVSDTDAYLISVDKGVASIGAGNIINSAKPGTIVSLFCDDLENALFTRWKFEIEGCKTEYQYTSAGTFVMPSNEIHVVAEYTDKVESEETAEIIVIPSCREAKIGDTVEFSVVLANVKDIMSFQTTVESPRGLSFVSAEAGNESSMAFDSIGWDSDNNTFWGYDNGKTYTSGCNAFIGTVRYQIGENAIDGEIAPVLFNVELFDRNNEAINYEVIYIPVNVTGSIVTCYEIDAQNAKAYVDGNNIEIAPAGYSVEIRSEKAKLGEKFSRWVVSGSDVEISDVYAENAVFVMPEHSVEIIAEYETISDEKFSISISGGCASFAAGLIISEASETTKVDISAFSSDTSTTFDHWEIISGNVIIENAECERTSFIMNSEPVELEAIFR